MKKIFVIIALVVALIILSGCREMKVERITTAKIRYFDGSMDTIEIDRWFASSGIITLHTIAGRKVVIGANNVIIIEETVDQYENKENDFQ